MRWAWLAWIGCGGSGGVSAATFNIEHFPRSEQQVVDALDTLAALDSPIVALQEITDPERLRDAIAEHWSGDWRFVTHTAARGAHRVGVLFDGSRLGLVALRSHESVRVIPGGRPALEARLLGSTGPICVFVVHLKAGAAYLDVRERQLDALAEVVSRARTAGGEVVVMGDFNSVTAADRVRLAAFARRTGLRWSTADMGCTALRQDGSACTGAALDHVFGGTQAVVRGPCAESCHWRGTCPRFVGEVSDHCPVVARLASRTTD